MIDFSVKVTTQTEYDVGVVDKIDEKNDVFTEILPSKEDPGK